MEFKDRLRALRTENGAKQEEMAELLGIRLRAYQNYEYGSSFPNYKNFLRLADYFGVSLDYLAGRSDIRELR